MTYPADDRAAIMQRVIEGLSQGTPLTLLCAQNGMPGYSTVRGWIDGDEQLSGDIARAREAGFDAIAQEALDILDAEPERVVTTTGEDRSESRIDSASVQRAKNRFEGRLKLLAKWDPKRYGELVKLAGADGQGPVQAALSVTFRKADDAA